ncbi:MAG: hypothetical protein Q9217_004524 [Psora testacea]
MYHYSVPPPGYVQYNYTNSTSTSPSSSPSPDAAYTYYIPKQYKSPPTKEYKRHARRESNDCPKRAGGWHSPAGFPSPSYYAKQPDYKSPPANYQDHVSSNFDRVQAKARRYSTTANHRGGGNGSSNSYIKNPGPQRHASVQSPKQRIIVDTSDEADDSPTYTYIKPRTAHKEEKNSKPKTNQYFFYNQVPARDESYYRSSRRPSTSRPSTAARPTKAVDPPREATATDAFKHGIPAGYSLKSWDPEEAPVMLLGSVFDANSLGKWIYDWTVFHHGPATPMSEVAGDLWLLLIKLAHKMKRADECLPRVRDYDNQELVEDFLESGDRLWARFKRLLKQCEEFMWKAAKKEGPKGGSVKMGKNSGCEFVDSIFGRDRRLEETESLMQSIRLWNMRFDVNCEDILRHPRA